MIIKNLGKDTLIYGGSDFLIKLVAFIAFPFVAEALTPSGFGALELIMTLVGLCGLLIGCGLNNAVQRFYWDSEMSDKKKSMLVSTSFFLQLGFWLIFAIILIVSFILIPNSFFDNLSSNKFTVTFGLIMALGFLIYLRQASRFVQGVIRLYFKPFHFFIFALISQGISAVIAMIIVVFFDGGVAAFILTITIIGAIALPIGLYIIRKDLKLQFCRQTAREVFLYGYPFIFAGLAYWLFSSMDRWMLSSLHSVEETGIYAVAFRFASIIFIASIAFGQAWSPYAIKIKTDYPDTYKNIYSNIFLLLVFSMLFLGGGVALYSGEIIALIMPSEYYGAAIPLAILSFAIILQSTQQITAVGISVMKKTKLLAVIAWLSAFINFLGNYFLIPSFGATGAAISTLLSYLFITSCYLFFTQRLHPLPISWVKVSFLASVALLIAIVSLIYNQTQIIWLWVIVKMIFALALLTIGLLIIPVRNIIKEYI